MKVLGGILISLALFGIGGVVFAQTKPQVIIRYCPNCPGYGDFARAVAKQVNDKGIIQVNTDRFAGGPSNLYLEYPGNTRPPVDLEQYGSVLRPNPGQSASDPRFLGSLKPEITKVANAIENQVAPEKQIICNVTRPGQTDGSSPPPSRENVSYKGNLTGYGNVTDQPGIYITGGPFQDTQIPIQESDTNFKLRRSGSQTMNVHINEDLKQIPEGGRVIVILPSQAQAEEFMKTTSSNKRGSYTINGVSVPVGPYGAKQLDTTTGIIFDEDCNPTKQEVPGSPFGNNTNNVGGNVGSGGGTSLGNLGSNPLLPLLMQGLLGQGLGGGQGGYGANNPYNNPYNPYTQQRQNCALQGTSPVCGTDGRTYTNICYLQQANAQLRTYGICPTATPTPTATITPSPSTGSTSSPQATPTPNATSILTQLTSSGIPASLLDAIRNIVARMLSNILSGGVIAETTIR